MKTCTPRRNQPWYSRRVISVQEARKYMQRAEAGTSLRGSRNTQKKLEWIESGEQKVYCRKLSGERSQSHKS